MSSSDIAISVQKLSKAYRIGHQQEKESTLAETLLKRFRNPIRRSPKETFWALRDVSFEVEKGDVVGVIGRNGAGKSTLLKILSRITEPTSGQIDLYGRIGSLLEVGTGFHPELTGRENVFLNGAILGMTKGEIRNQFDAIVDFAEIEKFLDTPVKRYSSGMYVRLAFAVAAHLNPEILIVDEVLAVGDASFQKKCLGKMGEVASKGKTVLFVSHNMGVINQLCRKTILLRQGSVLAHGATQDITKLYFESGGDMTTSWKRSNSIPEGRGIYLEEVSILYKGNVAPSELSTEDEFTIEVIVQAQGNFNDAEISIRFTNHEGIAVLTTGNSDCFPEFQQISHGKHRFRVKMPSDLFMAGTYYLMVAAFVPERVLFDIIEDKIKIVLEELGALSSAKRDHRLGVVNPRFAWMHMDAPNLLKSVDAVT